MPHSLLSVVTHALCTLICGAETWTEIAEFGEAMEDWFADCLDLPRGIPSHYTFNRRRSSDQERDHEDGILSDARNAAQQIVVLD